MRKGAQLLALVTLAGLGIFAAMPAQAQGRPDSMSMSCSAARALVQRSGAIVMQSGPGIYDRYVDHRGFCTISEEVDPAYIRTRDSRQCFVGFTCREREDQVDP